MSKFQRRVATLIFTLSSPNKNQIVWFLIFFPTVTSFLLYDLRFLRYKHLRQLFQTRADSLILIISSQIGNQFVRFLILFPTVSSLLSYDFRFLRYKHLRNFLLLSFLVIYWDQQPQFCGHSSAPRVLIS